MQLPIANAGGEAPKVDDGLALVRFDDLVLKEHPDWAGTDQYGNADDGRRYHFQATLMKSKTEVFYPDEEDPDSKPIQLDATTRLATGERSNFAAHMAGILTAKEFAAWQAATAEDPFDGSALPGRLLNVKIAHSKKGWPFIESFIGIAK